MYESLNLSEANNFIFGILYLHQEFRKILFDNKEMHFYILFFTEVIKVTFYLKFLVQAFN